MKRAALYIKANDMLIENAVFVPVLHRLKVSAISKGLKPVISGWANDIDNIQDWYREV